MLQGCCVGKLGPLQCFMMPGTHREAQGESFPGSGVHCLALWIVSLAAGFSIFYRRELFPLTVMKKDTLQQHLLEIGVRNMGQSEKILMFCNY